MIAILMLIFFIRMMMEDLRISIFSDTGIPFSLHNIII